MADTLSRTNAIVKRFLVSTALAPAVMMADPFSTAITKHHSATSESTSDASSASTGSSSRTTSSGCASASRRSSAESSGSASETSSCAPDLRRLEDDFALPGKVLGIGLSGEVCEAVCRRTGQTCAVKSFKTKKLVPRQLANLEREVDVLSSVDHPQLMKLEAVYETEECVHLVFEKLHGGEIFDKLLESGRFDERQTAQIAVQVLRAVAYLHARNFIHRDLKPENIMFEDIDGEKVRLIDFGFATRCHAGEKLTQVCGTLQYMAPEVLLRSGHDEKSDIWSIGTVLYTMLTNKVLYGGDDQEVIRKNKLGAINFSRTFKTISEDGQDFVLRLLTVNPQSRPSAIEALDHPWLRQNAPAAVETALVEAKNDILICAEARQSLPRMQLSQHAKV